VIFNKWVKSGKRNQLKKKQNYRLFTPGGVRNEEPTFCWWHIRIYIVCVCVVICLSTGRNMQIRLKIYQSRWVTDLRTRAGYTLKQIRLYREKTDSIDTGVSFSWKRDKILFNNKQYRIRIILRLRFYTSNN